MNNPREFKFSAMDTQLLTDFTQLMVDNLTGIKQIMKNQSRIIAKLENGDEEEIWREMHGQWKKESELLLPEYLPDFMADEDQPE